MWAEVAWQFPACSLESDCAAPHFSLPAPAWDECGIWNSDLWVSLIDDGCQCWPESWVVRIVQELLLAITGGPCPIVRGHALSQYLPVVGLGTQRPSHFTPPLWLLNADGTAYALKVPRS